MSPVRLKWQKVTIIVLPALLLLIIVLAVVWHHPSCNTSYIDDYSFQPVLQYCNSPKQPTTGQEGTVPPSDGFKLESVYVVIRHGDRSNLHSLPNYQQIELECQTDEHVAGDQTMLQYVSMMKKQQDYHKSNPKTSAFHGFDLYPQRSICQPGDLTPIGATQHVRNGEFLNKRYINALGLLKPGDVKLEDRVAIRSTAKVRTFQSAVAFLYGFLPEFDMSKLGFESAEECTLCSGNVDGDGVSCDCPSIMADIDGMASTMHQFTPEVMAQKRTRATYEEIGDVLGVIASRLPRPSHLFDVSMVHICHGINLPGPRDDACISASAAKDIHRIINSNGKKQVSTTQYQREARLKMYPLLMEIVQHMEKVGRAETNTVFKLYSGHDSTIDPLASVLNMSDGRWPRYASRIVFELYSDNTQQQQKRVLLLRSLYDGIVMTQHLPGCKDNMYRIPNLGLCELTHFQRYITKDFLKEFGQDGDYKKLCNS